MIEKIYLDTNIVIGWFKNRMNEKIGKGKFRVPFRLELLSNKEYELYVSYLVRAEIFQYLKTDWNLSGKEIFFEWQKFLSEFKIFELTTTTFDINLIEICEICRKSYLRKGGIIDLIHVQIARSQELIFLTDDNQLKQLLSYYNRIKTLSDFYSGVLG